MNTSAPDPTMVIRDTTPEERMEAKREAFMARGWPTGSQVAERLGSTAENHAQYASRLRQERKLFGVWSTQDGGTYIHPDFQFVDAHTISPHLPALLAALETIPGFSDDASDVKGGDPGRWRRLFWLYAPRSELSARSLAEVEIQRTGQSALEAVVATDGVDETPRAPADVFGEMPEAVIALARRDAADDRAVV